MLHFHSRIPLALPLGAVLCLLALGSRRGVAGEPPAPDAAFVEQIAPLLRRYCHECHAGERVEAEIDLARFKSLDDVRRQPRVWQQVGEMLESDQMPPPEAPQPSDEQRALLKGWVASHLAREAAASAGDPGPVVLRRLNNAQYTYTLRDLSGVATLDPAREFPVDGAAGEGFTNTGQSLVMSPSLVTKYLDSAKQVAAHAVLLPDGFRFSASASPSDWTNETLARIREFYGRYADAGGGDRVNLQGIVFETNGGGRLPVERYLAATLAERDALARGDMTLDAMAQQHGLNRKYLATLWDALTEDSDPPADAGATESASSAAGPSESLLFDQLRRRWRQATPADAPAMTAEISRWQQALWKFSSVGHVGKLNGPKAWMEPVDPLAERQEFRLPLAPAADAKEVVVYLAAEDAGDGPAHDDVVWERPRLVAPGRPDLLLRDVRAATRVLAARREQILASTERCLTAAAEALAAGDAIDVATLAERHSVEPGVLGAWLDYLGIAGRGPAQLGAPIARQQTSAAGYDFIQGWVGDDALSVMANSSDQQVRIPGTMRPHSVAVHPAPAQAVAIGWRSPVAAALAIGGAVEHAHPECGNGVSWTLELRRGNARQQLAQGVSHGAKPTPIGPLEAVAVQTGDVVALVVNPRDGNHACDLSLVELTLEGPGHRWRLSEDVSPDILAGNPHADRQGNAAVWHFFSEPASGKLTGGIPAGSLLAKWQTTADADQRAQLAGQVRELLEQGPAALAPDAPDAALFRQLTSLSGPLLSATLDEIAQQPQAASDDDSGFGLDPARFGQHPRAEERDAASEPWSVESASLCVRAPSMIEVRLPADLVAGAELVTTGWLHPSAGQDGSVQLSVTTTRPEAPPGLQASAVAETQVAGPWTSSHRGISHATPVVTRPESAARRRMQASFESFRELFPAALCYVKIVPVDEVVTLTLFHREDDALRRLMLDDAEAAEVDRLWNELHFVSGDALTLVDAFAQLMEYATQDADPKVFEPLREPILARAEAYRQALLLAEPRQLDALVDWAARAYRRPLADAERDELRALYRKLREEELSHADAWRVALARGLVSPAFLYHLETPAAGATPAAVSPYELASRLSYFLWSSAPDELLLAAAASGALSDPGELARQTERMLADDRSRRLAIEFGCQWLHVHGFDHLDEKSERHFPTFADLREAMYEETIRYFHDLFQHNGSVLSLIDADYTFVNAALAEHYGLPRVEGTEWRRVDGVRQFFRGGVLAQASTLATQSGASRTSPILRGAWLSEVVLGEKLPRPPKGVPVLADEQPAGLTERQLTERHSSDAKCAKCHARVDPMGFALEGFDAIGRFRREDASGLPIDARATLPDGVELDGLRGLQQYLLNQRREAFLRQFCRKLLGYALGRSVQLSDEPLLAEMQAALSANEYRVRAVVDRIVLSPQFRQIRGLEALASDEPR